MKALALLILLITIISLSMGDVIIVGGQSGDCPDADYPTIQQALDVALAGQTIELCGGTYTGATITKKITLRPVRGHRPLIVEGVRSYIDPNLLSALLIMPAGSGTIITGLQIEANFENDDVAGVGIEIVGAEKVEVHDTFISGAWVGIRLVGATDCLINHNFITDVAYVAIRLSGFTSVQSTLACVRNIITQNTFSSNVASARGVIMQSISGTADSGRCMLNSILDNDFFLNSKNAFGIALLDGNDLNDVMMNRVEANYLKGSGIYIASSYNVIDSNVLEGAYTDGIVVSNETTSFGNQLTRNQVRKSYSVAYRIDGTWNMVADNVDESSRSCSLDSNGRNNRFWQNRFQKTCSPINGLMKMMIDADQEELDQEMYMEENIEQNIQDDSQ